MKMNSSELFYCLFLMVLMLFSCHKSHDFTEYKDAEKPVVLGKGSLSLDSVQWNNVYVSDTREMYFTKMGKSTSVIHKMNYENGSFTNLKELPFPTTSPSSDVFVNKKGNLMLFSSLMQEHGKDTVMDWNIWKSERIDGEWQNPVPFFKNNVEGNQFYPWMTESRNLYFAITPHGSGNSDLYVAKYDDGKYQKPISLEGINSEKLEGDAFVAPDESYIIFAGFDRKENLGKSDLFISFQENGKWSTPVWLGEDVNSEGYDGSPFVTNDGRFLIFSSSRGSSGQNTFFNHYIVRIDPKRYKN